MRIAIRIAELRGDYIHLWSLREDVIGTMNTRARLKLEAEMRVRFRLDFNSFTASTPG